MCRRPQESWNYVRLSLLCIIIRREPHYISLDEMEEHDSESVVVSVGVGLEPPTQWKLNCFRVVLVG
jgi:hypothetical protein